MQSVADEDAVSLAEGLPLTARSLSHSGSRGPEWRTPAPDVDERHLLSPSRGGGVEISNLSNATAASPAISVLSVGSDANVSLLVLHPRAQPADASLQPMRNYDEQRRWMIWLRRFVLLALIGGITAAVYFLVTPHLQGALDWIAGMGIWAHFFLGSLIMLSGCPPFLTYFVCQLATGFIFRHDFGLALVTIFIGSMLGLSLGFAVGRVFKKPCVRMIDARPKLKLAILLLRGNFVKLMFLIRLSPLPFCAVNSSVAASDFSYYQTMAASVLPMLV